MFKKENEELIKALRNLGINDVAEEIEKAGAPEEVEDEEDEKLKEGEEDEDGEGNEIEKAIEGAIGEKVQSFNTIIKSFIDENAQLKVQNEELKKSIEGNNASLEELKKSVEKVLQMPLGTKSVTTANFIEKGGEVKDEQDRKVLSVSNNKAEIVKAMEDALVSANDSLKREYEANIIHSTMGLVAQVNRSVAMDLYTKHNIRIVE